MLDSAHCISLHSQVFYRWSNWLLERLLKSFCPKGQSCPSLPSPRVCSLSAVFSTQVLTPSCSWRRQLVLWTVCSGVNSLEQLGLREPRSACFLKALSGQIEFKFNRWNCAQLWAKDSLFQDFLIWGWWPQSVLAGHRHSWVFENISDINIYPNFPYCHSYL